MACHEGGEGLKTHPTCHSDTLGGRWVVVEVNGAIAAVVVVEGVSSDTLGGRWVRIPKFAHQWTFVELTGPKNNSKERKRKKKKSEKNSHYSLYETHTYSIDERSSRTGGMVSNHHTSQLKCC